MGTSTKLQTKDQSILISGGSGLVGTSLSALLSASGYTVSHLSRNPTKGSYPSFYWNVEKNEIDTDAIKNADVIIHLAGASVAAKRWTKKWKQAIYDSRINSTRLLKDAVEKHNPGLSHFISASAIGIYGWDTGDKLLEEDHEKGAGFLAEVVADWEQEITAFSHIGVENATVRVGIVLSKGGGALVEIGKPIRFGMGAPLASGKQFMSWIHIDDLCRLFLHILENKTAGIYNGVAPGPVTNKTFTKLLAGQLKKPLWLPNVPGFVLKLLVGEMAAILIGGNRVSTKKTEAMGFNFQFPALDGALQALLNKR